MDEPSNLPVAPLRRLARSLLYDREHAEDVVQDAWLAALKKRPVTASLTGWLAAAVRHRALDVRREEARRGERERRAARAEALPSSAELSAQLEILRRLLDAVDRLEEPYRAAIGLRFFDDLPPRAIAKRLGVPVNTVRTHVRRGLEKLRRALDPKDERGRTDLLAALAPFAGKLPWSIGLGLPRSASSAKLTLAASVLALAAGAWLVLRVAQGTESRETTTTAGVADSGASTALAPEPPPMQAGSPQNSRQPLGSGSSALSASWTVRGHVTRGVHEAYPNARLVGRVYANLVSEEAPILEQRFTADASGDFEWALEPPAAMVKVHVLPDMPAHMGDGYWGYFRPGEPAPSSWSIQAYPLDCALHGTVRNADGEPIAGARIVHQYGKAAESLSAADGRFTIGMPSFSEDSKLRVIAAGYAQRTLEPGELRAGDATVPDVVLASELRVRGHVLDESGNPVAGAEVRGGYPFDKLAPVTTDAAGSFALGSFDPESPYDTLVASKPGFVLASRQLHADDASAALELRLTRGVRLGGRVLSPQGEPVGTALVQASTWEWEEVPRQDWTWSDEQGRFELAHLAPGIQHVWVWRTGFASQRFDVELAAGQAVREGVELTLENGHFLAGTVRDEHGAVLPWAMVYSSDKEDRGGPDLYPGTHTFSGPDGAFRLEDLPARGVKVGVLAQGHARFEQVIEALDREDTVLAPPPSGGLAGRVIDADTGAALTSFRVRVVSSTTALRDEQFPEDLAQAWSHGVPFENADGTWRLAGEFGAGKLVRVTVEADGYAPAVLDPVTTALAPDPAACVAHLAHATSVRGQVLDAATGAPIAAARVRGFRNETELESSETPPVTVTTDAAGRFELANVPTGAFSLAIDAPEHALALDGPFEIAGSTPIVRWIELTSGARIEGHLLAADGHALAGETISLDGLLVKGEPRSRVWSATTASDGSFALEHLSAGAYHLRWEHHLGELRANDLLQLVELAPDEVRPIELQPRGHATLRGTIQFDGELPEVVTVVVLRNGEPPFFASEDHRFGYARSGRASFAEHGRFELAHLEPGNYGIVVSGRLGDGSMFSGGTAIEVPESGAVESFVTVRKH